MAKWAVGVGVLALLSYLGLVGNEMRDAADNNPWG
jgi:hypothetical protein